MKKCMNCGKTADNNNEIFCHDCGEKLIEIKLAKCKNCGATIEPDSDYCENCVAEMNSVNSNLFDMYKDNLYSHGSIYRERSRSDKALFIVLTAALTVCIIAVTAVCTALLLKDKVSKKEDPAIISKTDLTARDESSGEAANIDKTELKTEEDPEKNEPEPDEFYENKDETHNTDSALYDYDPDNGDWYRLRKSKWDPSTQVGAYKTVEKALSYAEIYVPQGYVLYDKDFNVITISDYGNVGNEIQSKQTDNYNNSSYDSAEKKQGTSNALYDYDPDNDDWYRLRKSKWDPSTQVGAYKTVEKALSYAEIYRPQGYVLYDKDFNVIE